MWVAIVVAVVECRLVEESLALLELPAPRPALLFCILYKVAKKNEDQLGVRCDV